MTKKHQLILKLAIVGAFLALIGTLRADQSCESLQKFQNLKNCVSKQPLAGLDVIKTCGLCFPGAPRLMLGKVRENELNLYSSQLKTIYLKVYSDPSAVSQSIPITTQITTFLANQEEYKVLQEKAPYTRNIDALYQKGGALYNPKKPNDIRYKMRRISIDAGSEQVKLISTPSLADKTVAIGLQITVPMPYTFSLSQQKGGSLVPQVVRAWWLPKGGDCTIQVPTGEGKGQLKLLQCKIMDNAS